MIPNEILALLANENISSTSSNINRKHSKSYLYFQDYCNSIKIVQYRKKQFSLNLDVAYRVYCDILNKLKPYYLYTIAFMVH